MCKRKKNTMDMAAIEIRSKIGQIDSMHGPENFNGPYFHKLGLGDLLFYKFNASWQKG